MDLSKKVVQQQQRIYNRGKYICLYGGPVGPKLIMKIIG